MQRIRITTKPHSSKYEVVVGHQLLNTIGEQSRAWLGSNVRRIALVSNPTVFALYGSAVVQSLKRHDVDVLEVMIADNERAKTLRTVERNLSALAKNRFQRTDGVLALGGGVVGDVAGFTAAVYQRGVRWIYAPTTLLSQIDSSIGGKTGVNLSSAKNFVGSFHQPAGVFSDVATLSTLPRRELTSGLFECIKQAAVGGRRLFDQLLRILEGGNVINSPELVSLITAQCRFKATIVKNDEREKLDGTSSRSRRILNFGHTVGHALEQVTNYRRFRHGEAVGLGMLTAGEISKRLGLLRESDSQLLETAVGHCGRLPRTDDLDHQAVLKAIASDKKSASNVVQWVLLESIGKPRVVGEDQIGSAVISGALRKTLKEAASERSLP